MNKNKILKMVMILIVTGGIVSSPINVGANVYEKKQIQQTKEEDIQVEAIYKAGNQVKSEHQITQEQYTSLTTRDIDVKPIFIGIKWIYTNKAGGSTLRAMFRKMATIEGAAGIASTMMVYGLATGGLTSALGALVGIGAYAMHARFNEGANLIYQHAKSGKIWMYLDHCIYKK